MRHSFLLFVLLLVGGLLSAEVPTTFEMEQCESQVVGIRRISNRAGAMPAAKFKAYSYSNSKHEILWEKNGDFQWNSSYQTWALDDDSFVRVRAADYSGEGGDNAYLYLQLCFWVDDFSVKYNGKIGPKEGVYTVRQAQYYDYGYGYWYLDDQYLNNSVVGDGQYASTGFSWSTSMNELWNRKYHSPYCAFIAEKTCDYCTPNYFSLIPINSTVTVSRGKDDNCYVIVANASGTVLFTIGEPTAPVTKNVSINNPTNGSISVSYNDGSAQSFSAGNRDIDEYTALTISANPNPDYHCTSITINGTPFTSGNIYTLTDDITIGATFAKNDYFLDVTSVSHGNVVRSDNGDKNTVKQAGDQISLNLEVEEGYEFKEWTGDTQYLNGNVFTIPSGGAHNTTYLVSAVFQLSPFTITYYDGHDEIGEDTYTKESTPFALLAEPQTDKPGYDFAGWYDNISLFGNVVTAVEAGTTGDLMYWASWNAKNYNITLNRGTEGTADGNATITFNSSTLTSITNASSGEEWVLKGYYTSAIGDVLVITADGALVAGVSDYTDADGRWIHTEEATTLYAQWAMDMKTLTVNAAEGGEVNSEVNGSYTLGTEVTIFATADNFYLFKHWLHTSTGDVFSSNATVTLTIDKDYDLTAVFEVNTDLVLTENKTDDYYDDMASVYYNDGNPVQLTSITYIRTFKNNKYSDFSLPFHVYLEGTALDGFVYQYDGASYDAYWGLDIHLSSTDEILPGIPYFVCPKEGDIQECVFLAEGDNEQLYLTEAIDNTDGDALSGYTDGQSGTVRFFGNNRSFSFPTDAGRSKYVFLNNSRLYYPNAKGVTMRPFRGYMYVDEMPEADAPRARIVLDGQVVAELEELAEEADGSDAGVSKYVKNGVLIIERNGIRYNATGTRMDN